MHKESRIGIVLILDLLHYIGCFLYLFLILDLSDKIIRVRGLWTLQLMVKEDFDNLAVCLGEVARPAE